MINAYEQCPVHFYKIYTVPRKNLIKQIQSPLKKKYPKYVKEPCYRKKNML